MDNNKRRSKRKLHQKCEVEDYCWSEKHFCVKVVSEEVGRGLFSKKCFQKGDFLLTYDGIKYAQEPDVKDDTYLFQFAFKGKSYWIDASAEDGSLGRLLNDEYFKPNCVAKSILQGQTPIIGFFATRNIGAGAELRYSYGLGRNSFAWRSKGYSKVGKGSDTHAHPVSYATTHPVNGTSTNPVHDTTTNPVIDILVYPVSDAITHPVSDTITNPVDDTTNPVHDILAHPVSDILAHPVNDTIAQPVSDTITHPVSDTITHLVSDTITQPVSDTIAQPVSDATTHPVRDTTTHPLSDILAHPVRDILAHPVNDTISQPVSDTITHPVSDTIAHPVSDTITHPVSDTTHPVRDTTTTHSLRAIFYHPVRDTTAHRVSDTTTHPETDILAHPVNDTIAHQVSDTTTHPVCDILAHPVCDTTADLVSDILAYPVSNTTTNPVHDATTYPVPDTTIHPVRDILAHPVNDTHAHLVSYTTTYPVHDTTTHPVSDGLAHPVNDSIAHPMNDITTYPAIDTTAHSVYDISVYDFPASPVNDSIAHIVSEMMAYPTSDKAAQPASNAITHTESDCFIHPANNSTLNAANDTSRYRGTDAIYIQQLTSSTQEVILPHIQQTLHQPTQLPIQPTKQGAPPTHRASRQNVMPLLHKLILTTPAQKVTVSNQQQGSTDNQANGTALQPLSKTDNEDSEEDVQSSGSEYQPDDDEVISDTEFSDCSSNSTIYPMLTPASKKKREEEITVSSIIQHPSISSTKTNSKIRVMQTNNSGARKYDKVTFCPYCDIGMAKLLRHLIAKHKNELDVVKYELEKDDNVKKSMLTRLRNIGNHRHNADVLRRQEGELVVVYRPGGGTHVDPHDYVPCEYCFGYYVSWDLWQHHHRCPLSPPDKPKHARVLQNSRFLLPSPHGTSTGLKSVLDAMKLDEIGCAVKGDPLILQLGERLFLKNGHDQEKFSVIRNTLRQIARLLLELRRTVSSTSGLRYFIDPILYRKVVESAKVVAGFQESTHQFNIPSLALNIGHTLKKCSMILESEALQSGDDEMASKASKFSTLCVMRWKEDISTHALRTLNEQLRNKVKLIPLVQDVTLLTKHLKATGETAYKRLSMKGDDSEAWVKLNEATLTQIMQFNRRRQGEVSKAKLVDYGKRHTAAREDLNDVLSPLEQKLCESLQRVEIVGKRGRTVPMILTKEMRKWLDLLLFTRDAIGVNPQNEFLFPRCHYGSLGHIRGCDTLKDASKLCGAKYPELLRSTKLRKQIGTLSQLLNLQDNELDILATFMGHDIRVHREYYRLPEETLQVAKISKVLLSLESGQFAAMSGKSLDEISVDVDEDLNVAIGECQDGEEDENEEEEIIGNENQHNPVFRKKRCIPSFPGEKTATGKAKKRPWTEEEVNAVMRHFSQHVC